jgi:phosphopantothenoylcysteine decarboxylase/phosphopantothenate--cysteine ligase
MEHPPAEAASRRAARVLLISGPTALKPPSGTELTWVESASQMLEAVLRLLPESSIVIKTAAVADYTVRNPAEEKLKRTGRMTLDLEPTTDILAEVARRRTSQVVIGFAAETQNVIENAKKKLASKSLDAIVVNDVSKPGIGFDSERNAVTILSGSGSTTVPETSKWEVAQRVLDQAVKLKQESALTTHPLS